MNLSTAVAAEKTYPTPCTEALAEYSFVKPKSEILDFDEFIIRQSMSQVKTRMIFG